MIQDSIRYLRFIPSPTKLRRDIVTLPSVLPQHLCELSRINIHQWILTKLGTYLVLKRIWNPIDFQGYRSKVKVTGSNIQARGYAKLCVALVITIIQVISLLVDYQSLRVSSAQQSVFLSLGRYLCWWTISPRGYHQPSSQCLYHWVDTSAGGLLVPEGTISPVVSVSITGLIPLLVDYQSQRVPSAQQSVFLSLG